MRVLSIGNSFSEDAQAHLHQIARASGQNIYCSNLYIGGCPLVRHYRNMITDERAYAFGINGTYTGISVSLSQALLADWDVVTLQQASIHSPNPDSYFPYITELAKFVRRYLPKTKIWIHETWAYGADSNRFNAASPDQRSMYENLHKAYARAAEEIDAAGIIPCGTAFQRLLKNGETNLHRDGSHASFGLGRFTLSATWITALTGTDLRGMDWSSVRQPEGGITAHEIEMAQLAAYEACQGLN